MDERFTRSRKIFSRRPIPTASAPRFQFCRQPPPTRQTTCTRLDMLRLLLVRSNRHFQHPCCASLLRSYTNKQRSSPIDDSGRCIAIRNNHKLWRAVFVLCRFHNSLFHRISRSSNYLQLLHDRVREGGADRDGTLIAFLPSSTRPEGGAAARRSQILKWSKES